MTTNFQILVKIDASSFEKEVTKFLIEQCPSTDPFGSENLDVEQLHEFPEFCVVTVRRYIAKWNLVEEYCKSKDIKYNYIP